MKRGDWNCPKCANHNFASRDNCRACGASKNSNAAPVPSGGGSGAKTGDWSCSCGEHNFSSRTHCRKCQAPKPSPPSSFLTMVSSFLTGQPAASSSTNLQQQAATAPTKKGDWSCACGELNFASRVVCRKCGASPASASASQASNSQHLAHSVVPMKPGDWNCVCGELNFARNKCCRKCKTVPNMAAFVQSRASAQSSKPGDWNCVCGESNWARNTACRKCGQPNQPSPQPQPQPQPQPPTPVTASSTTRNEEEEDQHLCVVCMLGKSEVAIIVCGHLALCASCASKLNTCPLCRARFTPDQAIKIFQAGITE